MREGNQDWGVDPGLGLRVLSFGGVLRASQTGRSLLGPGVRPWAGRRLGAAQGGPAV